MKRLANLLLMMALALCLSVAQAQEAVVIITDVEELLVSVGRKVDYQLTMTQDQARRAGYTFATSDEAIATVDRRGLVTGVAPGQCQLVITSKYDTSVTKTLPVTVVLPVKKVTAQAEKASIHLGETTVIETDFMPENATWQEAVFTSSNEAIATVDGKGLVTGVARGQAIITVRARDGGAKTNVRITVRQQPESVSLTLPVEKLSTGKRTTVKVQVLPKNTDNKTLSWSSSDEGVATVNQRGQVMAVAPGTVTITASCVEAPDVCAAVQLSIVRLAKSVAFTQKTWQVLLGESQQLNVTVSPEDTSDIAVSYHSSRPRSVSVDENGIVTALAAGKAIITATTKDGSRRQGKTTVEVIVPVTGVHFRHSDMRVGAGSYSTQTAILEPKEATDKNMSWSSSDTSIATVSGSTNRVRISGRQWGRCQVTGVTEDGGYSCNINVNVGSLRHAVGVNSIAIKDGRPYIVLKNHSNMNITRVRFILTGTDEYNQSIVMSSRDGKTLYGEYNLSLAPGEKTKHGAFDFYHHTNYPNMQSLSIAVTGWETDTGYYGDNGALYYDYSISDEHLEWETFETDLYEWTQKNQP